MNIKNESDLLTQLFLSLLTEGGYNLSSAHFMGFDPFNHIPTKEKHHLAMIGKRIQNKDPCNDLCTTEYIVANLLKEEAHLCVSENEIVYFPGSTREAIDYTIEITAKKKVALPVPNWHFWRNNPEKFSFFNAHTDDEFLSNFRRLAATGTVDTLLLAYPSVPLMHTPKAAILNEIDNIATKNGITIIVDDVLRGVQPLDQRLSVASHLLAPIIVEGFSKRFGDDSGSTSYIAFPGRKRPKLPSIGRGTEEIAFSGKTHTICSKGYAQALEALLRYATLPALRELESRNNAFDEGLRQECPNDTIIYRPTPTHITSLLTIPPTMQMSATTFATTAFLLGIYIAPASAYYYNDKGPNHMQRKLRITVGRMDAATLREVGASIGAGIAQYSGVQ